MATDNLLNQVLLLSRLKYGSQRSGLRALLVGLRRDLASTYAQQHGVARGLQAALGQTSKGISQAYDQAGQQIALNSVGDPFKGLGAGADTYRAAEAARTRFQGQATARERASALSEVANMGTQAAAGERYANQAASSRYASDRSKILDQLSQLGGEEGAFRVTKLSELERQQASDRRSAASQRRAAAGEQRAQSHEQFQRTHGTGPYALPKPKGGGAARPGAFTGTQKRAFRVQVNQALGLIKSAPTNIPRSRVHAVLLGTEQPPKGVKVPRLDPNAVNIAMAIAWRGGIGTSHVRFLRRAGIPVGWFPLMRNQLSPSVKSGLQQLAGV